MSLLLVLAMAASQPGDPAAIAGDWAKPSRDVIVRIAPCGAALCGRIVEASETARRDALKAGTVDLVGTQVLTGLAPSGRERWRGTLFVPDKALTTRARLVRAAPDELRLVACDRTGLICRTQVWRRAESAGEGAPGHPPER